MGETTINFDINVKLGGCENSIINFVDGVVFCNKNLREDEKEKNSERAINFLQEEESFLNNVNANEAVGDTINDNIDNTADDNIADNDATGNDKRVEVYVPQENECGLYLSIGNFVIILASKSGRIIGVSGNLNSVKCEKCNINIPQNFIDGELALSSEKKLSKGLLYAYDINAKVLFDEQKNILQLGDGSECDLTVRVFKNMYVLVNGGKISAFVIDGNLRI